MAATAARFWFPGGAGLGVGTTVQVVPSQCSASRGPPKTEPTAHASVEEEAATPYNRLPPSGLRLESTPHDPPQASAPAGPRLAWPVRSGVAAIAGSTPMRNRADPTTPTSSLRMRLPLEEAERQIRP